MDEPEQPANETASVVGESSSSDNGLSKPAKKQTTPETVNNSESSSSSVKEEKKKRRNCPERFNELTAIFGRALKQFSLNLLNRMLHVVPIPALSDNYMYLLIDKNTNDAALVDPVEPEKALAKVKENQANLRCVLTTHHHWDHAGGNEQLNKLMPDAKIFSGAEHASYPYEKVSDGKVIQVGSLTVKCMFTPCHTQDHICYYVEDTNGEKVVFTGDTLFAAGCGRFFEGTADQMYESLIIKLGSLPDETKVYCGHEYTAGNLKFARHAEPSNVEVEKKLHWAEKMGAEKKFTIPSTIAEEKKTNPFMRVQEPGLKAHANQEDPVKVMDFIRKEKDNFKC